MSICTYILEPSGVSPAVEMVTVDSGGVGASLTVM
jgi:hypothetical protein